MRQKLFILPNKDLRPYKKWRTDAWVPLNHFSVSHYRLFVYFFIMPPVKKYFGDFLKLKEKGRIQLP